MLGFTVVLLLWLGFLVVGGFLVVCGWGFSEGFCVAVPVVVLVAVVVGDDFVGFGGFGRSVLKRSTILVGSVDGATVVSTVWNVKNFVGGVVNSVFSSSWITLLGGGVVVRIGLGVVVVVVVVVVVIFFFFVVVLYKGFPPVVPFEGFAVVRITK